MNSKFNLVLSSILTVALGLSATPSAVLAQTEWSTSGSTGTVDEQDLPLVQLVNNEAQFVGANPDTLTIRYNIVPTTELTAFGFFDLVSRFQDNGTAAQVVLRLKRFNISTGTTSTIATFNSNSYPASVVYQTQSLNCIAPNFDFANNTYYVDADLVKTGAGGVPRLGAIQVRQHIGGC